MVPAAASMPYGAPEANRLGPKSANRKVYAAEYRWVSIEKISPEMAVAAIAAEDQNFATHSGFDYKAIEEAIAANPGPAADFKAGKVAALNFLKGQVMKLSKGKANPGVAGEILERKLKG